MESRRRLCQLSRSFRNSACIKLFLLGVAVNAAAHESYPDLAVYLSRMWRTQDGLPDNRVQAIAQTADGYLWVGTSGGLARFDGTRFIVYGRFNTPSITDDNVLSLAVAPDDSLWVATEGGGLLHYSHGVFRSFGAKQGLTNDFVNRVYADHRGVVWAATQRGLFRYRGDKFERVDLGLHLTNISFQGVTEDAQQNLIAVGPSGVFKEREGHLLEYAPGLDLGEVYRISQTRDGTVWLDTSRGLKRIPPWTRRPQVVAVKGHTTTAVDAIVQDHLGTVWLGSRGDGLFALQGDHETVFTARSKLPDNSVSAIFEDRDHSIWVGTANGLAQLSAPDVQIANGRDGLTDQNVSSIYRDRGGGIWITTITGRIFRYHRGRFERFHLPSDDNLQFIGTYQDHSGAMWFGTVNAGAVRLMRGRVSQLSMSTGLRNNGIQAFFEDSAGNLWIGTSSGIAKWDGSHIRNFYVQDGLSYGWIRSIAEDADGDLLVGTDRGLNRFHAGRFVSDDRFARLAHDRIWAIFPESNGTVWIGTRGGGLVRIKGGAVTRLTTREGLLSNSIFQLLGYGDRLWMSAAAGVSSASLSRLNSVADGVSALAPVISYSAGDDAEPAQMNGLFQPSACFASNGELWFPSVRGAVRVNPAYMPIKHASPVQLESFSVDGELVPASSELVVPPGRRRIEIEFTSVALRSPEQVSFRYRLDNFDEEWTVAGHRRTAEYDNLPAGRYRFEVVASDPQASSSAAVVLVVRARFYRTGWFYALAVAFGALCLATLFYVRKWEARNRYNLRLEERSRIAREMHDTVIQGCLGVSTLVEVASSCASSDHEQMLECLDNARMHLRLTIDEARQALSDLRQDSFESRIEDALPKLVHALQSESIAISLGMSGPPVRLPGTMNRALAMVAREAIRNAIAHADPVSIGVSLAFSESDLRLEIADDGCGFDLDPVYLAQSSHFGILGMRERMDQIGGSFHIESRPGEGTIVVCIAPVGKEPHVRDRRPSAEQAAN